MRGSWSNHPTGGKEQPANPDLPNMTIKWACMYHYMLSRCLQFLEISKNRGIYSVLREWFKKVNLFVNFISSLVIEKLDSVS